MYKVGPKNQLYIGLLTPIRGLYNGDCKVKTHQNHYYIHFNKFDCFHNFGIRRSWEVSSIEMFFF